MSTEIKVVETINGKALAAVLGRLSECTKGVKFKLQTDTNGNLNELCIVSNDGADELRLVMRNYSVIAEHTKTAEQIRFELRFKEGGEAFKRLTGLGIETKIRAKTLEEVRTEAVKLLTNIGLENEHLKYVSETFKQEVYETATGTIVAKEREAIESDKDIVATTNDTDMPF